MNEIMGDNSQLISLIIDIALIAGLFALWLIWYRNGNRQQKLEQLLGETAHQLDEATQHLNQATLMIEQLKRNEEKPAKVAPPASRERELKTVRKAHEPELQPAPLPPENSTQATMVLRMHREGENPEAIADRLDIPLAQVKLLLKLYASKSAA